MARVKRGFVAQRRRKKILDLTEGSLAHHQHYSVPLMNVTLKHYVMQLVTVRQKNVSTVVFGLHD